MIRINDAALHTDGWNKERLPYSDPLAHGRGDAD